MDRARYCFPVESRNRGMKRTKFKICIIHIIQTGQKKKKRWDKEAENTSHDLRSSGKSVSDGICNKTSEGIECKVLVLSCECCVAIPFKQLRS